MQLDVKDIKGKKTGDITLDDAVFASDVNEHLLWETVKWQLAKRRAGTHMTKRRGEVWGTKKKPFKQKGTGRARQGSNTSPLMPGGGRAFGPKPRDYRTELPKKQRRAALVAALSQKAGENAVTVLDSLSFAAPKTKEMAEILKRLGLEAKRTLLVIGDADPNVVRSCRNLRNLNTTLAHQINPYDLLQSEAVIMTAPALAQIKEIFAR